jgi:hypothetical protein
MNRKTFAITTAVSTAAMYVFNILALPPMVESIGATSSLRVFAITCTLFGAITALSGYSRAVDIGHKNPFAQALILFIPLVGFIQWFFLAFTKAGNASKSDIILQPSLVEHVG